MNDTRAFHMKQEINFRCGFIALIGRPNVGKSSLMNRIIKKKISIVSAKPQTTRNQIRGVLTNKDTQYIFVDTPGIHQPSTTTNKQLHQTMNKAAIGALSEANVIVFMIDAKHWTKADEFVSHVLSNHSLPPIVLALNKVDKIANKRMLLPTIERLKNWKNWQEIIPISGLKGDNIDEFMQLIRGYLPINQPFYEEDVITDRNMRFIASEMIREQLTLKLNQELPYGIAVQIDHFTENEKEVHIGAIVWVERVGQKAIVIGSNGRMIKLIGTQSRLQIQRNFGKSTHLHLFVKVRSNQSDAGVLFNTEQVRNE